MARFDTDYIGFTFNGMRSERLGLLRVSNGSRYTSNLFPTISDKIAVAPGADRTYYFGSNYTQKTISIDVAYDNLKEENIRQIKYLLGDKNIYPLILDETPYLVHYVKVSSNSTLSFVPFFEKHERVYKGEGTLQFIAYEPYGRLRRYDSANGIPNGGESMKFLSDYNSETMPQWKFEQVRYQDYVPNKWYFEFKDNKYVPIYKAESFDTLIEIEKENIDGYFNFYAGGNLNEWYLASGINNLENSGINVYNENQILVYNPGDIEAPFLLNFTPSETIDFKIAIEDENGIDKQLIVQGLSLKSGDSSIRINSKLNLIEGLNGGIITNNIYNEYIVGGQFFNIPRTIETFGELKTKSLGFTGGSVSNVSIDYDYLYL